MVNSRMQLLMNRSKVILQLMEKTLANLRLLPRNPLRVDPRYPKKGQRESKMGPKERGLRSQICKREKWR